MTRLLPKVRGRRRTGGEDSRIALLEALIAIDDLATCAQRGLEWLVHRAGVPRAACLVVSEDARRLIVLAAEGQQRGRMDGFAPSLDERREDRRDPLVDALLAPGPTYFARHSHRGLIEPPFHALPLRRRSEDKACGLLVVHAASRAVDPSTAWLARILGERLSRVNAHPRAGVERTLASEATLLHNIINSVSDPILLTDTEGKLLIANFHAERLFSSREDDNEGRRRAVALNNMLFSSALAAFAIGQEMKRELPLVDPTDGSDLLFELLSSTIKDPHAGGTSVVSILRNVTDLGRATEELRENYRKLRIAQAEVKAERRRLDLIIDSVADPILVTDAAGDIVLMNAPAEKLFTVAVGSSSEARARVRANDAHFSSFVSNLLFSGTDQRYRGEIGLTDPHSGLPMPVEAIAGKILSEHGELTAVVTILHDRTEALENARLYAQLQRAADELEAKVHAATAELAHQNELLRRQAIELEQASALKTQFLANVSHEFRTPLNAILGYTHMLLKGVSGELQPQQRRSLQRVDSNSRHLLAIINEILDITRIEAGRMPLNVSDFDLTSLVSEVQAELEPIIARTQVPVETDIAADVPALRSDRQKVKQIVLNLLANALKFTHQGWIRVSVRYDAKARRVVIAVRDTGIGIAPEYHERVFDDFQQVDPSTTRPYTGTGLGLSISKRLAHVLGGDITLTSALGKGSTFTFELPARVRRARPRSTEQRS